MLDGFVRTDVYEQRIDLDEFAGNLGFSAFWQAPGIALLCGAGLRRKRGAGSIAARDSEPRHP